MKIMRIKVVLLLLHEKMLSNTKALRQVVEYTLLILVHGRQWQADLYELQDSLVYIARSRTAGTVRQRNLALTNLI